MSSNNNRPYSDSFDFVIPVNVNSAPSQSISTSNQLSPFHSSTRNYRHSALVESGQYEYHPPVSPATSYASAHSTNSAMDLDSAPSNSHVLIQQQQLLQQQQQQLAQGAQGRRLPPMGQLGHAASGPQQNLDSPNSPGSFSSSQLQGVHGTPVGRSLSISGLPSYASPSSTFQIPPPPPATSASAQQQQAQARSRRTSSSHRTMAYSPNPPPQQQPDLWSIQTSPTAASNGGGSNGGMGLGGGIGGGVGGLPQAGLMRRGLSYDGIIYPYNNGASTTSSQQTQSQPPPPPSQQIRGSSLLPTSFSSGLRPSGSYSPSGSSSSAAVPPPPPPPSSLMPGIRNSYSPTSPTTPTSHQRTISTNMTGNAGGNGGGGGGSGSSSILPPTSPSVSLSLFGFSPNPNNGSNTPSSQQQPPTIVAPVEHNRHASYSPSHYAAQPSSSSYTSTPSFYAHHIPATSSTTSLVSLPQSQTSSSYSQQPPPQPSISVPPLSSSSQSQHHHPQAQQYYQSQQYFDSTLPSSSSNPNNQPSSSASSSVSLQQQQQQQPQQQQNSSISAQQYYAGGDVVRSNPTGSSSSSNAMAGISYTGPPQPQPEARGFRKVRDLRDIVRVVNSQPAGRRADPMGGFISPLKALTVALPQTYHLVNPNFRYETSLNPRRVLTKPSKPAGNEGFDNDDSDYILYVNDVLGPEEKDRYLILDVLGQGTFGQVVKCQNMKTHEIVAVKVVKNKPAYFQQSMMEVTILELINNQWDKDDSHHMLRLKDTFIHHAHLCLVFELLSNNLYELIKQNSFRGLSTSLVRVFTAQLLDALTVLQEAKIIHCDLKPENILLKSLQSPTIKVIDFGSACHEKQTVYTYIQSRFYRSPEVILSLPYSVAIDMWSLGCICVELFLGLPLFPGTSEYNQITRIVEMLGMPPDHMLEQGKQSNNFFDAYPDEYGRRRWRLKSLERYSSEHKTQEQPSKKYFSATTLPEIIKQYPITKRGIKETEIDKEMANRVAFIDFVKGLLQIDPELRWSPQQARLHPFVLGEPLKAPFVPPPMMKGGFNSGSKVMSNPTSPDPNSVKRYGGLPPTPQRSSTRTYQDAKAYNQHLTQQQNYHAQAQQAAQRAAQVPTNPYADQNQQKVAPPPPANAAYGGAVQQAMQQQQMQAAQQAQQAQAMNLSFYGAAAAGSTGAGRLPQQGGPGPSNPQLSVIVANPPAVHHYTPRGRSNTVTQDLPPALQKLGHELGMQSGTGQSITPVLRREEQWQAWERIQNGGGAGAGDGQGGIQRRISLSRNPHLNLLQEQAENGLNSWNSPMRGGAKPAYSSYAVGGPTSSITAPPQVYSNAPYATAAPSSYPGFQQQQQPPQQAPPPPSQLPQQQQGNNLRPSFYPFYSS